LKNQGTIGVTALEASARSSRCRSRVAAVPPAETGVKVAPTVSTGTGTESAVSRVGSRSVVWASPSCRVEALPISDFV
jgi:hypothetical protein